MIGPPSGRYRVLRALETHGHTTLSEQWVEGSTLRSALGSGRSYSPFEASILTKEVAASLSALHGKGSLYRVLCPETIIVAQGESGVGSHCLLSPDSASQLFPLGTSRPYCAPEQRVESGVDDKTDVYALGAVVAEVLGGISYAPPELGKLLSRMGAEAQPLRPSISQVLETLQFYAVPSVVPMRSGNLPVVSTVQPHPRSTGSGISLLLPLVFLALVALTLSTLGYLVLRGDP